MLTPRPFTSVLVANRGEIAVRVLEDPASLVAEAAAGFAKAARSDEGAVGMTAFLEKRKPKWAQ